MNMQKGFTLIELMIVVAIIGILAAVAVPQYTNYIERANGAVALSKLSGVKAATEETYALTGTAPTTTHIAEEGGIFVSLTAASPTAAGATLIVWTCLTSGATFSDCANGTVATTATVL